MKKDRKRILLYLLIAFSSIMYISLIFNDSLWGDEAYTMMVLKKNFVGITKMTAVDVHPPLYYYLSKILTMIFGYSVSVVKLVSVLPFILTNIFIVKKSKTLFKKDSSLISVLFVLLFSFIPRAFSMNVELRMYSLATLFVTCSGVYAYELYNNEESKKNLILFIISSLAAAYTHYYAALTVCFVYLFLIIGLLIKNIKNYKLCITFVVLTIIGYLPWLPIFIKQFTTVRDNWWLTTFSADQILKFMEYLFNGEFTHFFMILFAFIIFKLIIYIFNNSKDKEGWYSILLIACFTFTILTGYAVSKLLRPLFLERYMYPGVGLFILGICISLSKISDKRILMELLVCLVVLNIPFSYNTEYVKEYKTGTESFKLFAETNIKDGTIIYTDISHLSWTILPYYLPNNEVKSVTINKNTRGILFTSKSKEEIYELIPNSDIETLFSGDINNTYYFNIYEIK